jgi:hypothetical protein
MSLCYYSRAGRCMFRKIPPYECNMEMDQTIGGPFPLSVDKIEKLTATAGMFPDFCGKIRITFDIQTRPMNFKAR